MDLERMFTDCQERGWLFSIQPDEFMSMDGKGFAMTQWEIKVWNIRGQAFLHIATDIRKGFEEAVRALALIDKGGRPFGDNPIPRSEEITWTRP